MDTDEIVAGIKKRNPHQPTFYQAVAEVIDSIKPVLEHAVNLRSPGSGSGC